MVPVMHVGTGAEEEEDDETLLEDDTLLDDDTLLEDALLEDDTLLEDEELVLETEFDVNVADVRARRFPVYG